MYGSVGSAAGILYDCDLPSAKGSTGFVQQKMAIVHQDNGTVQVIDGVLIHFKQSPKTVNVVRNTDEILTFRWDVKTVNNRNQRATLSYDARLNKKNGKIRVGAKPLGYSNSFFAKGTCKERRK